MLSEPNKDSAPVAEVPADLESRAVFKLQPDPPLTDSLSVDELLRYHDRSFVQRVYKAIAKRNPTTNELATSLAELRTGDKSKIEIIEEIVAKQKAAGVTVVIAGLPSPALRKLGRWPVIGPFFRVLRGVTRLPVMMQNQQRFESYAIAQQQRLADFLNEVVAPQVKRQRTNGVTELKTTEADVVESVMMLSDSVVELAAKQTELSETLLETQDQLRKFSEHSVQVSTQLTTVEASQRELQSQAEKLAREPQQLQNQITSLVEQLSSLVEQRDQSETLFRRDLVNLTQAIQALQGQFEEFPKQIEALNIQTAEHATSQREFLIQEQRLIVEAQKVALNELQSQLAESEERTQTTLNSLAEIVQRLRAAKEVE